MLAEAFKFRVDQTVGAVLRSLASDDEDLESYRCQHLIIIDDKYCQVGVVSRTAVDAAVLARLLRPKDAMQLWPREVSIGVINGIVLCNLIAIVCSIWKGNPNLGLAIGLELAVNTVIAVSIGGVVPLSIKGVGHRTPHLPEALT